jgi:hypothetical protein
MRDGMAGHVALQLDGKRHHATTAEFEGHGERISGGAEAGQGRPRFTCRFPV